MMMIKKLLNSLVIVFASFCLLACTSMRVVADGKEAAAQVAKQEKPFVTAGRTVFITTADGRKHVLQIASIGLEGVVGTVAGQSQEVRIPVDQIVRIEHEEVDVWKVALFVGAVLLFAVLVGRGLGQKFAAAASTP